MVSTQLSGVEQRDGEWNLSDESFEGGEVVEFEGVERGAEGPQPRPRGRELGGDWAFGLANARADEESFEFYGGSGIVGSI